MQVSLFFIFIALSGQYGVFLKKVRWIHAYWFVLKKIGSTSLSVGSMASL